METNETLLIRHGIATRLQDGKLEALDVTNKWEGDTLRTFEVWVRAAEWTRTETLEWLGY